MAPAKEYCPKCKQVVELIVWETCCGTSYNCSVCGHPVEFEVRDEEDQS